MTKIKYYKTPKAKHTYYFVADNQAYRVFNTQGLVRKEKRMLVNDSYSTNYEYLRLADFINPVSHVAEKAVEVEAETIPFRLKKSFMYYTSVADNRRYKNLQYQNKQLMVK